jgi:Arc/MetJ-type ribon-helix-helix transcriptional regulator
MNIDPNEAYNVVVPVTMCKQLAEYLDRLVWKGGESYRSMSDLIRGLTVDGLVARGYVTVSNDEPERHLPDSADEIDIADLGI